MFQDSPNGQTNYYLPCGHSYLEHCMMEEALGSAVIEGAKTDRTICELIELSNK